MAISSSAPESRYPKHIWCVLFSAAFLRSQVLQHLASLALAGAFTMGSTMGLKSLKNLFRPSLWMKAMVTIRTKARARVELLLCCCGVLYALTPPRGSASPLSPSLPLKISGHHRGSRSHKKTAPPPPPQPSTSTPSPKVIHSLSVDTSYCLLRPGFGFGGGFPDISSENSSENSSGRSRRERCPGALEAVRPVRSATATATTGDPSRSTTRARGSDPGLDTSPRTTWCSASRRCFAMSMAAVAFEVFSFEVDGTKTDDAGR